MAYYYIYTLHAHVYIMDKRLPCRMAQRLRWGRASSIHTRIPARTQEQTEVSHRKMRELSTYYMLISTLNYQSERGC